LPFDTTLETTCDEPLFLQYARAFLDTSINSLSVRYVYVRSEFEIDLPDTERAAHSNTTTRSPEASVPKLTGCATL